MRVDHYKRLGVKGLYRAAKEIVFRAGHYLRYGSEQEKGHEHHWRVRAVVESEELDESHTVMDFHLLGKWLEEIVEPFTKVKMINDMPEFEQSNPSTEQLARYIHEKLVSRLGGQVRLKEVVVWESPDSRASFAD